MRQCAGRTYCRLSNGSIDTKNEATNASINIKICNGDGGLIEVFTDLDSSEYYSPPASKRIASVQMPSDYSKVRIKSFSSPHFQEAQNNAAIWEEQYIDGRLLLSTKKNSEGLYANYTKQNITGSGYNNTLNACHPATSSTNCTPGTVTGTNDTFAGIRIMNNTKEVYTFTVRVLDSTRSLPPPNVSDIPTEETDDSFLTAPPAPVDPNAPPVPDQVIQITDLEGLGGGGGGSGTTPNPTRIPSLPPLVGPITSDPANEKVFTSHAPIIDVLRIDKENEDRTFDTVVEYTGVANVNLYQIEIDQPNAAKDARDVTIYPVNDLYAGKYAYTTLADEGHMNVRLRGAFECSDSAGCDLIVDGSDYKVPNGETQYTRWSQRFYVSIGLLTIPDISEGTTIDPTGESRWEGSEELQQTTGGMIGQLMGLEAGQERNTALIVWMLICLGVAIWVYVKAWRKSGTKSALSPIGGALATISLIFSWSILGYVFFDMKAGTAFLPLAAIIFMVILKSWNTVKSR